MSDPFSELVKRGLALPREERKQLVDQLLESLNEPAATELNDAWESEIERRLLEYDQGSVPVIDAEAVFAKARLIAR